MSTTSRRVLLTLLSILDTIAWLATPVGWLTVNWVILYDVTLVSGLYASIVAIAFSGTLSLISTMLLFGPKFDLDE